MASFQPVNPKPFIKSLINRQVVVRLKWNKTEYRGKLISTDNYLNLQLDNTYEIIYEPSSSGSKNEEEKVREELIGNIFIRCNNVLFIREWKPVDSKTGIAGAGAALDKEKSVKGVENSVDSKVECDKEEDIEMSKEEDIEMSKEEDKEGNKKEDADAVVEDADAVVEDADAMVEDVKEDKEVSKEVNKEEDEEVNKEEDKEENKEENEVNEEEDKEVIKTIEDEKANEAQLAELSIEVESNGVRQFVRPEATRLNGVDNLSTDEIKSYVEYYLNYTTSIDEETSKIIYNQIPFDKQLSFRVEWIDDSNVNIVFKSSSENRRCLELLSQDPIINNDSESDYINEVIKERQAKPYNPIVAFRKNQSLLNRLGLAETKEQQQQEEGGGGAATMDEDESFVELRLRQSFQSDRKVKNASQFSRYYLLHGEPERQPRHARSGHRQNPHRESRKQRGEGKNVNENVNLNEDEDEDLFADRLKERRFRSRNHRFTDNNDEEDLFPEKLKKSRSRSPIRRNNGLARSSR
ncbi:hypothetical protein KGF56_003899 [Candida oxycetoniae]|uniref:Sm protein F n=1 Tax=Candida oxycetoniae TaxID=497107 RepID=A0AAI9WWK3_9ASCO|nr:uncharacterized protein KGF56_003899 [Candida oxycetoniae]KAI3403311.2 hypothetical protein KGF56_003899 [Candida oxycetoniae]